MNHSAKNISILEKSRRNGRFFLFPELNGAPQSSENSEENKHCNDARVGPFIFSASPLKGQKDADDGGDKDEDSNRIHPPQLIHLSRLGFCLPRRVFEENGDE